MKGSLSCHRQKTSSHGPSLHQFQTSPSRVLESLNCLATRNKKLSTTIADANLPSTISCCSMPSGCQRAASSRSHCQCCLSSASRDYQPGSNARTDQSSFHSRYTSSTLQFYITTPDMAPQTFYDQQLSSHATTTDLPVIRMYYRGRLVAQLPRGLEELKTERRRTRNEKRRKAKQVKAAANDSCSESGSDYESEDEREAETMIAMERYKWDRSAVSGCAGVCWDRLTDLWYPFCDDLQTRNRSFKHSTFQQSRKVGARNRARPVCTLPSKPDRAEAAVRSKRLSDRCRSVGSRGRDTICECIVGSVRRPALPAGVPPCPPDC